MPNRGKIINNGFNKLHELINVIPFLTNLGERVNETNHPSIGFVEIGSFEFVPSLLSVFAP